MLSIVDEFHDEIKLLKCSRFEDDRGWFSEVYNRENFERNGISIDFIQDNQSLSSLQGTVRGIHFQTGEFAQAKLIRVLSGSICDVALNIDPNSDFFGQHIKIRLDAKNGEQLFIPSVYAHAFMTLEPNTQVIYKVDNPYNPDFERGILWNDPSLNIQWPHIKSPIQISEKDQKLPTWEQYFGFGGKK